MVLGKQNGLFAGKPCSHGCTARVRHCTVGARLAREGASRFIAKSAIRMLASTPESGISSPRCDFWQTFCDNCGLVITWAIALLLACR